MKLRMERAAASKSLEARLYINSFLLCSVLTITACGGPIRETPVYSVKVGQEYVDRFKAEAKHQGVTLSDTRNLITRFSNRPGNEIGRCIISLGQNTIVIDPGWWGGSSPTDQEELIYHELGHCWLKRMAHNNALTGTRPVSIMYYAHIDASIYLAHYDEYMAELFGGN